MAGDRDSIIAFGTMFSAAMVAIAHPSGCVNRALNLVPVAQSQPASASLIARAQDASPSLSQSLASEQMQELFQGLSYLLHDQYVDALPILSKYALMGDARAQSGMGSMYYAGLGITPDRDEAIRWFRLAAAQGGQAEQQTLASAIDGSWQWDRPNSQPAYATAMPALTQSYANDPMSLDRRPSLLTGTAGQDTLAANPVTPMPVGPGHEDMPHASDRYRGSPIPLTAPVDLTLSQSSYSPAGNQPVILNRAGGNQYSGSNGDSYTQAGPHGVVNNRTGQFSPTN